MGEPSHVPHDAPLLWKFGYVPGSYMCECCECHTNFEGDKRAIRCDVCARKMMNRAGGVLLSATKTSEKVGIKKVLNAVKAHPYPEGDSTQFLCGYIQARLDLITVIEGLMEEGS